MRIAIVHYHLRGGGVSTVIRQALRSFRQESHEAVLITGDEQPPEFARVFVQGLGYDSKIEPEELCRRLRQAALQAFHGPADLWHFHNHALGKNAAIGQAVADLARDGQRLLLQLHDFAEDGRLGPAEAMMDRSLFYPNAPHVHFACVNQRDMGLLQKAGLPNERIHYLPNPVEGDAAPRLEHSDDQRQLWFYPTRGIPRKNLGEAVMLAVLGRGGLAIATSQSPENPAWHAQHSAWEDFAKLHQLPIYFGAVGRYSPKTLGLSPMESSSFEAWLSSSTAILTTSRAEGFGYAFLEPQLWGIPVVGRALPEILADYEAQEIEFPGLYSRLEIHGKILGLNGTGDWIDFASLRDELQREAIRVALETDDSSRVARFVHNGRAEEPTAWIKEAENRAQKPLEKNRSIVQRAYSPARAAESLLSCYAKVRASPTGPLRPSKTIARSILSSFSHLNKSLWTSWI